MAVPYADPTVTSETEQLVESQTVEPTLPTGTEQTYTTTEEAVGEQAVQEGMIAPTTGQVTAPIEAAAPTPVEAVQIAPIQVEKAADIEAVTAAQEISNMQAAQAELSKEATVQGQLENLFAGVPEGEVPMFAKPAVEQVEAMLAERGMGRSSVARDALYNAIITSAMPIATADAAAKQQEFFANLSNEQQALLTTYQSRNQALLTDAAAQNAAKQFNAASQDQTNQFMANLAATISQNNAARTDAMVQFQTSAQIDLNKFNAQIQNSIKQFNAQNALIVEQSNTQYRRDLNTADTAGINATNQQNAQNAFNLSNQALSFLWQEMRDEATWAFESGESALNRAFQEEITAMEADAEKEAALYTALGTMGADLFTAYITDIFELPVT